jgi:hypothetical protein
MASSPFIAGASERACAASMAACSVLLASSSWLEATKSCMRATFGGVTPSAQSFNASFMSDKRFDANTGKLIPPKFSRLRVPRRRVALVFAGFATLQEKPPAELSSPTPFDDGLISAGLLRSTRGSCATIEPGRCR